MSLSLTYTHEDFFFLVTTDRQLSLSGSRTIEGVYSYVITHLKSCVKCRKEVILSWLVFGRDCLHTSISSHCPVLKLLNTTNSLSIKCPVHRRIGRSLHHTGEMNRLTKNESYHRWEFHKHYMSCVMAHNGIIK